MNLLNRFARPAILVLSFGLAAACGRVPGQFEIVTNQVPARRRMPDLHRRDRVRRSGDDGPALGARGGVDRLSAVPVAENNLPGRRTVRTSTGSLCRASRSTSRLPRPHLPPRRSSLRWKAEAPAIARYCISRRPGREPWAPAASSRRGDRFPGRAGPADQRSARDRPFAFVVGEPSGAGVRQHQQRRDRIGPVRISAGDLLGMPDSQRTGLSRHRSADPTGNPCNIAQDRSVDCCQSGNDLYCPSVVAP